MPDIDRESYAFVGSGDIDPETAAALLDDYMGNSLGAVYRPTRVPRSNRALSDIINWLESPDMLGLKGTVPSEDVVADLLERRRAKAEKIQIIYLWPGDDKATDADKELVQKARAASIPVMSLTDGIDELTWEPEPEPEPEPGADEAQVVAEDYVTPLNVVGSGLFAQLEVALRAIVRDEVQRVLANGAPPQAPSAKAPAAASRADGTRARRPARATAGVASQDDVAAVVAARLASKAPVEIEDDADGADDAPVVGRGPKFSGGPAADLSDGKDRFPYYLHSESGRYRRAKSRPKREETRVELTEAEIDDIVQRGLMDDK